MTMSELNFTAVGQALIKRDMRPYLHTHGHEVMSLIRDADLAFTNFEGAIEGRHGGWPTKDAWVTISQPYVLDVLREYGFNMLSLANNHAFDLGPAGILSTLEEVEKRSFLHAGIGEDFTDGARPGLADIAETKGALIAFDCGPQPDYVYALDPAQHRPARPGVHRLIVKHGNGGRRIDPDDESRVLRLIAESADEAGFVSVYMHNHHWEEDLEETLPWVRDFSRECVDAGANAVICHGVPLLQGAEVYRSKPIFYGLGNFIFHTLKPDHWIARTGGKAWEGIVAQSHFRNGDLEQIRFHPIAVGGGRTNTSLKHSPAELPQLLHDEEAARIIARFSQLSRPLGTEIVDDGGTGVLIPSV